jgi:hypothetical protein
MDNLYVNKCQVLKLSIYVRRVWRYQRGYQNPYRRRTDNTKVKRKSTKGQTMI